MTAAELSDRVKNGIRTIPDFPQSGVIFRDITPVLSNAALLGSIVRHLTAEFAHVHIDVVVAIESRGFILGAPLAVALGAGFAPIRKPGKLPHRTLRVEYDLEYGTDALEAHIDAVSSSQRVLLIDDVLATGGTANAALRLIDELGGDVVCAAFLVELAFLSGRTRLGDVPVFSLVRYDAGE